MNLWVVLVSISCGPATQNIDLVCQYILPFLHKIIIYCLFLMNLILEKNQNVPQLKTMTIIICYGGSC